MKTIMLFNKSKSKFVYQSRTAAYLKLICILLFIILPIAALQAYLVHSNKDTRSQHEAVQFLAIPTSQLSATEKTTNAAEKRLPLNRRPFIDEYDELRPETSNGRGEFFDVNQSVSFRNKSILRVRRSELPELHSEPSLATIGGYQSNTIATSADTQPQDETKADSISNSSQDDQDKSQTGSTPETNKRTLVSISSKSGRFSSAVLPLDDLVVAAVDESGQGGAENNLPATNAHVFHGSNGEDRAVQESTDSSRTSSQPGMADLVALNSKSGFSLGDLTAQTVFNEVYNPNAGIDPSFGGSFNIQQSPYAKELPLYQPMIQPQQALVQQQQVERSQPVEEAQDMSDGLPDSMESLMNSEGEPGVDEPAERQDSSASSLVQNENNDSQNEVEDDENEEDDSKQEGQPILNQQQQQQAMMMPTTFPMQYPIMSSMDPNIYGAPQAANIIPSDHMLVAPMRDSLNDLNVAAGHYYGKKKKKKKVIVKKKKKVIVKKKKIKKKKVKVIKYKVKKIKVKKVKKKKKKGHHHDHGKYYMYAKVPKKKAWEFGFKKGNKKHWIERHEKGHKNKFKTKVKWYDKKSKGKGVHIWDYNHHDKKKKHYG